jgi:hypothetical protein
MIRGSRRLRTPRSATDQSPPTNARQPPGRTEPRDGWMSPFARHGGTTLRRLFWGTGEHSIEPSGGSMNS